MMLSSTIASLSLDIEETCCRNGKINSGFMFSEFTDVQHLPGFRLGRVSASSVYWKHLIITLECQAACKNSEQLRIEVVLDFPVN